ncbi:Reticulocyte-binding protein 2 homolog a [Durusdinium trenchii]|uniref:Reticulocyte-binding protein 2 homolog a n=1 Tax=Durusdinium trenchii TaxID=1381693 RepID=A0ABP0KYK7_9DINO
METAEERGGDAADGMCEAAQRIRAKNAGRVPIICSERRGKRGTGWKTKRSKFLVSEKLNVNQFRRFVRGNLVIKEESQAQAPSRPPKVRLYLRDGDELLDEALSIATMDTTYRDPDGFLYLSYSTRYSSKHDALVLPEPLVPAAPVTEEQVVQDTPAPSADTAVETECSHESEKAELEEGRDLTQQQEEDVQQHQEKEQDEEELEEEDRHVAEEEQEQEAQEQEMEVQEQGDKAIDGCADQQQQLDQGQSLEEVQHERERAAEEGEQVEEQVEEEEEEEEVDDEEQDVEQQETVELEHEEQHKQEQDTLGGDASEAHKVSVAEEELGETSVAEAEEHDQVECPATDADADDLFKSPVFAPHTPGLYDSPPPSLDLDSLAEQDEATATAMARDAAAVAAEEAAANPFGGASEENSDASSSSASSSSSTSFLPPHLQGRTVQIANRDAFAGFDSMVLSDDSIQAARVAAAHRVQQENELELTQETSPSDWVEVDGEHAQQHAEEPASHLEMGKAFLMSKLSQLDLQTTTESLREFAATMVSRASPEGAGVKDLLFEDDGEQEEEEWTCVNFDGPNESFGAQFL